MPPEVRAKMCPRLTAALVVRNGPGLASIPCGEHECQLWWKCKGPQTVDEVIATPSATDSDLRAAMAREAEAVQPQECISRDTYEGGLQAAYVSGLKGSTPEQRATQQPCADLEAIATRLSQDILALGAQRVASGFWQDELVAVALKALQEVRNGR